MLLYEPAGRSIQLRSVGARANVARHATPKFELKTRESYVALARKLLRLRAQQCHCVLPECGIDAYVFTNGADRPGFGGAAFGADAVNAAGD